MKISILLTAYKEEKTIAKCIESIIDTEYSGIPDDFELLLAAPDNDTENVASGVIKKYGIENKYKFIKDPAKGKPNALNMLMEEAKGDIWIFTDGDVYFAKNAVKELIKNFEDDETKIVTGRPISEDSTQNMMGYFGHLLADAAHHKRMVDLNPEAHGKSLKIIKSRKFFPVSGYIYAIRSTDFRFPVDCLVDDAYISYVFNNKGWKINYEPKAIAYVKYPKNLKDYFIQKKRSTGGYVQLWKYGIVTQKTKSRSFWRELEYFWFPIKYASNIKELFWSFLLYPIRLWLWIQIYFEQKVLKKDLMQKGKGWKRVESTK